MYVKTPSTVGTFNTFIFVEVSAFTSIQYSISRCMYVQCTRMFIFVFILSFNREQKKKPAHILCVCKHNNVLLHREGNQEM